MNEIKIPTQFQEASVTYGFPQLSSDAKLLAIHTELLTKMKDVLARLAQIESNQKAK